MGYLWGHTNENGNTDVLGCTDIQGGIQMYGGMYRCMGAYRHMGDIPCKITSGVKQGCMLAPTLFESSFPHSLKYTFQDSQEGVFLHTRSDGKLFSLARLRTKTRVRTILIHELLFADDAALVSHTADEFQELLNRFSHACKELCLIINIKKSKVMGQDVDNPPNVMTDGTSLDIMNPFTYIGAIITSNLSLDKDITTRIGKASVTMLRLSK